jgi:hypothetical protein
MLQKGMAGFVAFHMLVEAFPLLFLAEAVATKLAVSGTAQIAVGRNLDVVDLAADGFTVPKFVNKSANIKSFVNGNSTNSVNFTNCFNYFLFRHSCWSF